ncbi:hypothetical protein HK098_002025 [Nowakowskiella sp. JEL0407]|nr:hypothetical protein HK098_002025 [Nowakowskiella sp. JEL0407]
MHSSLIAFYLVVAATTIVLAQQSQDYAKHLALSLEFYEAQRLGKLPANNRIPWRGDSTLNDGSDNNVDLTGGYADAGDNVKFNFPAAYSMTVLAWSGIEFEAGFKSAQQYEKLQETVRWGTDYMLKCWKPESNTLYVQVGDGQTDHAVWVAPERITYSRPSYRVTTAKPGSDVAGEFAAAFAAASILFKSTDPTYSATLLSAAKSVYDFADKYRGKYSDSVTAAAEYYKSWGGYNDELVWGAAWIGRASGDSTYVDKAQTYFNQFALGGSRNEPISWDSKTVGCYALLSKMLNTNQFLNETKTFLDFLLPYTKTPGGLQLYPNNLSNWGANRYASNGALIAALYAKLLPSGSDRSKYVSYAQSQIDYMQGKNPKKVNYVVGANPNSVRNVHHRAASGTYDSQAPPPFNIYYIRGALAGGPGADDSYADIRSDYQKNEVALDYNAAYTGVLAFLHEQGLTVPDPIPISGYPPANPPLQIAVNIQTTSLDSTKFEVQPGIWANNPFTSWKIQFTQPSNWQIGTAWDCVTIALNNPTNFFAFANRREYGYLYNSSYVQLFKFSGTYTGTFKLPDTLTVVVDYDMPFNKTYVLTGNGVGNYTYKAGSSSTTTTTLTTTTTTTRTSTTISTTTTTIVSPSPSATACTGTPVALNGQCGGKFYSGSTCCGSGAVCTFKSDYYSQCTAAPSPSPSPSPSPLVNCQPVNAQCGGQFFTGVNCCVSGSTCTFVSQWYSQCR